MCTENQEWDVNPTPAQEFGHTRNNAGLPTGAQTTVLKNMVLNGHLEVVVTPPSGV